MKKSELVKSVAEDTGMTQTAVQTVMDSMLQIISEDLYCGGSVTLGGFGTFSTKVREPRMVYNPVKKVTAMSKKSTYVKFTPAKKLKEFIG